MMISLVVLTKLLVLKFVLKATDPDTDSKMVRRRTIKKLMLMKICLFFNLDIFSFPPTQAVSGISYKEALGNVFSFLYGKMGFKGINH